MKTSLAGIAAGVIAISAAVSAASSSGAYAQQRDLPRGDYDRSCSDLRVRRNQLSGECDTYRGETRQTVLDLSLCAGLPVANFDGFLVCGLVRGVEQSSDRGRNDRSEGGRDRYDDSGRWDADGSRREGGGRWRDRSAASITVYRDGAYRGLSASFTEDVANLRLQGLNDAISSFRIARGGRWEVCEDADFKGRCETVSGEEADLGSLSLNDRISSMRPVGGDRRR